MIRCFVFLLAVLPALSVFPQNAYSKATEQLITGHVDKELQRSISLLEQAVNINSG